MSQGVAGTARLDITPTWPVLQGGFGQRVTPCIGVHDPVLAKSLYFANGAEQLLLITVDLICIPSPLGKAVVAALIAQTDLTAEQICICASHTHSGPLPFDASGNAVGVAQYTTFLTDALVRVASAAIHTARPCRVRVGVGEVDDLFLNRRTRGQPNVVDKRVAVLAVEDASSGELFGVLFGVGCHPVTLGWDNMQISADFPGVAQAAIEAELTGVNALFFNTTEGNVIPRSSPNADALDPRGYCGGSFAETLAIGLTIADEVVRVLRDPSTRANVDDLHIAARRADLRIAPRHAQLDAASAQAQVAASARTLAEFLGDDFATRIAPSALWSAASAHVIAAQLAEAEMRRLMLACCYWLGLSARLAQTGAVRDVNVPVQMLRINELLLLALPGEVLVETGQDWQRLAASDTAFIVGLANAHLRYLPAAAHFAEADADSHYETVTAGLGPNGMEIALAAGMRLLSEVRVA